MRHNEIILPEGVWRGENGRYEKLCPQCGKTQNYLRKAYAVQAFNNNNRCNMCANSDPQANGHKGYCLGVLRISFLNKFKKNASLRGIPYEVSDEYLAKTLIDQDFRCALSGRKISAMGINNDASIDRIDSSVGYIEGNVHWVHKMVNMCKQQYSLDDFLSMCEDISNHLKGS